MLDLDDNELASWADVQTLGRLPCLERLSLTGNSIVNIAGPGPAATGKHLALAATDNSGKGAQSLGSTREHICRWLSGSACSRAGRQLPCELDLCGRADVVSFAAGGSAFRQRRPRRRPEPCPQRGARQPDSPLVSCHRLMGTRDCALVCAANLR